MNEAESIMLGRALAALAADQSEWSQATFGTDAERGPIGGLKHLRLEADEAIDAAERLKEAKEQPQFNLSVAETHLELQQEMADCLILLLDASRRAGISPLDLVIAGAAKMVKNRLRTYPRPTSDAPSQHIREAS